MVAVPASLSLSDLEGFDPYAPAGSRERRFCCPLPGCLDKPRDVNHRSLSLNVTTGAWRCHRCQGTGILQEHRRPRRELQRSALRRAFAVTSAAAPAPESSGAWRQQLPRLRSLAGTAGARYLAARGINEQLAMAAGAHFSPDFYGRAAVVFPVRDWAGELVALHGRHIDAGAPKSHTGGSLKLGVFASPGALDAPVITITEAPIDALSLAAAGVPAIALCGTSWPDWLPAVCAFKSVVVALDGDTAGDEAAARLTAALQALGATVQRWRPTAGKDWNQILTQHGADALAERLAASAPEPSSPLCDETGTAEPADTPADPPPSPYADYIGVMKAALTRWYGLQQPALSLPRCRIPGQTKRPAPYAVESLAHWFTIHSLGPSGSCWGPREPWQLEDVDHTLYRLECVAFPARIGGLPEPWNCPQCAGALREATCWPCGGSVCRSCWAWVPEPLVEHCTVCMERA